MLVLGFPLGFFLSGIFSGTGAFLAELFPVAVRGSGQGFCYSIGRAISAFCPALIGGLSVHRSLGFGIGTVAAASYGLVVLTACLLPETKGTSLREAYAAA
jgi:MFS family permease